MSKQRKGIISLGSILDRVVRTAKDKPSFRELARAADLDPARDFVGASLRGVDFRDEDLRGFNFSFANLTGADLRRANLDGVSFVGAKLTGAIGLTGDSATQSSHLDRDAKRPNSARNLLAHSITDNPTNVRIKADDEWYSAHAGRARFYVSNIRWLDELLYPMRISQISFYRRTAVDIANSLYWWDFNGSNVSLDKHWEEISLGQYNEIIGGRPVLFAKAALFLLTCELALQNWIDTGRIKERSISNGEFIYTRMNIVPACWIIEGFSNSYLKFQEIRNQHFLPKLSQQTGMSIDTFFKMAAGFPVSFFTARNVKSYCDKQGRREIRVGKVTCRSAAITKMKPAVIGEKWIGHSAVELYDQ